MSEKDSRDTSGSEDAGPQDTDSEDLVLEEPVLEDPVLDVEALDRQPGTISDALALPLSMILSLVCATGGALMFASLYAGCSLLLGYRNELAVPVVQHFTMIVVFSTVFSTTLTLRRLRYAGGRSWTFVNCAFIVFFFAAYYYNLWPQAFSLSPDFLLRVLGWLSVAVVANLLSSIMAIGLFAMKNEDDALAPASYSLCLFSIGAVCAILSTLAIVISPLYDFAPLALFFLPQLVLIVVSVLSSRKNFSGRPYAGLRSSFLIVYPFSLSFLCLTLLVGLESLIGNCYGPIFEIDISHYVVGAICCVLTSIPALIGGAVCLPKKTSSGRQAS